jgi:hypothetical protein
MAAHALITLERLRLCRPRAEDGDLGLLHDFLFDDRHWRIRYFVIDPSIWLPSRKVLLLPALCERPDPEAALLPVDLNRGQVRQCPDVDLARPVSRQMELEIHRHYGRPVYWAGPEAAVSDAAPAAAKAEPDDALHRPVGDANLRSAKEVSGYRIQASDGEIGHVEDFLADERDWTIHGLVVDTKSWLPGRKVVVGVDRIEAVDWAERSVITNLDRAAIRGGTEFDPHQPMTSDDLSGHRGSNGRPRR